MVQDKLKWLDLKYFLLPLAGLSLLFLLLSLVFLNTSVTQKQQDFRNTALSIADSYAQMLSHSREAYNTISSLLDDKLEMASQAVPIFDHSGGDESIADLAHRLHVDEIYVYDAAGKIQYSNTGEYIGWQAFEGHPVHTFMTGELNFFVEEEIRRDTESDRYLKYAYIRNEDGTFYQIGVKAENLEQFLEHFEYSELVNHAYTSSGEYHLTFINSDNIIVSSSLEGITGATLKDERVLDLLYAGSDNVHRIDFEGSSVYLVGVPVLIEDQFIGNLVITWEADELANEIQELIFQAIFQYLILLSFFGAILYYAYRKNKANVRLAFYDALTGLPNEVFLNEYLEDILKTNTVNQAIILIRIENLATLNLLYGSSYGNVLYVAISNAIQAFLSHDDRLFSYAKRELVYIRGAYADRDELQAVAGNLVKHCRAQLKEVFDQPQEVQMGVGVVEMRGYRPGSSDTLLQNVSLALSSNTRRAGAIVSFYEDAMEARERSEYTIERSLRAITEGRDQQSFSLHYQPKIDLECQKLMGFEALARLELPALGFVSPPEFIHVAEKKFLIYDLGKEILRQACEFIQLLQSGDRQGLTVAVNISGLQLLREEFLDDVKAIVSMYDIDIRLLEFEITETTLLDNFDLINEKLQQIKHMGITISLDDFGTGYSSFVRLRELYIDSVKIDRYFIRSIVECDDSYAIAADIISMAHKMGLSVVAEDVETEAQLCYLRKHSCDLGQGYYISRPLPTKMALDFSHSYPATNSSKY
ncbi:MAG TPA: bifunctional diguanylate cyclase/phosphodiesterase [Sphaerochaetaceae bacterium]|nr:bifunctional diguanylate cyclase/phosphodiesterase [Sphaerochaetaceae bacterium]